MSARGLAFSSWNSASASRVVFTALLLKVVSTQDFRRTLVAREACERRCVRQIEILRELVHQRLHRARRFHLRFGIGLPVRRDVTELAVHAERYRVLAHRLAH